MKKLLLSLLASVAICFCTEAQTSPANKAKASSEARPVKSTSAKTQSATVNKQTVVLKKDGTPDKRYASSRKLKKDGTPDKRFKSNQ